MCCSNAIRFLAVALGALSLSVGGCAPATERPSSAGATGNGANNGQPLVWPFWPTHLRVHPLTRLMSNQVSGQLVLEARVEFLDAQEVTSKAVGKLTLTILDGALPAREAPAIQFWNVNLNDIAANNRHFDLITRTYLFRLEIDAKALPDQAQLEAYFVSADGQTMKDSWRIRR